MDKLRDFFQRGPMTTWGPLVFALMTVIVVLFGALASLPSDQPSIVGLEMAGRWDIAQELDADPDDTMRAIYWDFPFVLAYVALLGGLVLWSAPFYRLRRVRELDITVAIAVGAAGVLDIVENVMIILGVQQDYSSDGSWRWVWPVASTCAWAKFLVLLAAILYVVGALTARTRTEIRKVLLADDPPLLAEAGAIDESGASYGIAFSGGGIRAASISLGALQAFEHPSTGGGRPPLAWSEASTVTSVSGGSYMTGAWSVSRTPLSTDDQRHEPGVVYEPPGHSPEAWAWSGPEPSPEEAHLRTNLGYLASSSPRGTETDALSQSTSPPPAPQSAPKRLGLVPSVVATLLSGLVLNMAMLLTLLWLVVQPVGWIYHWFIGLAPGCAWPNAVVVGDDCLQLTGRNTSATVTWLVVGAVSIVGWVLLAKRINLGVNEQPPRYLWIPRIVGYAGLGIGGLMAWVLVVFPFLMNLTLELGENPDLGAILLSVIGAAGSLGSVGRILWKPAAKYAPVIGGLFFFALIVFLAAYWAKGSMVRGWPGFDAGRFWVWVVVAAIWFAAYYKISPEWWSMAPYYRSKVRSAYATYRDAGVAVPYENGAASRTGRVEPSFWAFTSKERDPAGTPLTVCASATVSGRSIKTHYGIPALSVTFTPDRVRMFVPLDDEGKWREYTCSTRKLGILGRRDHSARLTTMMAVALSGAAVSPAMGRFKIGPTSMLLTFANIRLGMWIPNPRYASRIDDDVKYPMPRMGYLLKEFFGIHDPTDLYLYVTDGGHWENTGLVELLRSSDHQEMVCVDADPGPGNAVRSIAQAIDLATLECGAKITMNLDPLRGDPMAGLGRDYSPRSVNLALVERSYDGERSISVLWYSKPALIQDMPPALLAHRETHPSFPRVTTVDQFFDTSQFVAYRDLGRYNGSQILRARRELADATNTFDSFRDFVDGLEPGAHWVLAELPSLINQIAQSDHEAEQIYDDVRKALRRTSRQQGADDRIRE